VSCLTSLVQSLVLDIGKIAWSRLIQFIHHSHSRRRIVVDVDRINEDANPLDLQGSTRASERERERLLAGTRKLRYIIEDIFVSPDLIGHPCIRSNLDAIATIASCERIYQRKRYRTEFLSEHERARNVRDLHRGDLEPWPRGGDRYQDGGRGRGADEPQPRRRLCNGGLGSRAGLRARGERPARLVPPLLSFCIAFSPPVRPVALAPSFLPPRLFFSRGLVFILALSRHDECQPR